MAIRGKTNKSILVVAVLCLFLIVREGYSSTSPSAPVKNLAVINSSLTKNEIYYC